MDGTKLFQTDTNTPKTMTKLNQSVAKNSSLSRVPIHANHTNINEIIATNVKVRQKSKFHHYIDR